MFPLPRGSISAGWRVRRYWPARSRRLSRATAPPADGQRRHALILQEALPQQRMRLGADPSRFIAAPTSALKRLACAKRVVERVMGALAKAVCILEIGLSEREARPGCVLANHILERMRQRKRQQSPADLVAHIPGRGSPSISKGPGSAKGQLRLLTPTARGQIHSDP